jgi:Cu2+-exporting ATPase
LTAGRARLAAIACEGATEEEALARAAGLERHSEHGLARAIRDAAAARGLDPIAATDIRAIPGRGIRGMSEAGPVAAGNGAMMAELGWPLPPTLRERARALEASGHSVIHVGWGGEVRAVLALDDIALPEARATIAALRALGLHAALLTGDLAPAARRVAVAAGIDVVQAELSPEAKRLALDAYASRFGSVAMVGDGLNDGPVLAMADVGIAVGSATDLARETAGVVLPPGGLKMLPWIVTVARAVRRTILTNLLWAFGYNLVALALAVFGLLQPVLAAAVMASSSLLLVVNSLRLSRLPDPAPASAPQRQPGTELDVLRSGADIPDIVGLEPERG